MRGAKPGERRGGREKGVPNKKPALREAIIQAFDKVGGVDYLVGLAGSNPQVFCMLLGKVVPAQVAVSLTVDLAERVQRARERVGAHVIDAVAMDMSEGSDAVN